MRPAVSNMGRYRSYSGKISKGHLRKQDGKNHVGITNAQGKLVNYVLARLVKVAFHGRPEDATKTCVVHLDHDKTHNMLSNLEWQTPHKSSKHTLRAPNRNACKELTEKEVLYRRKGTTEWTNYSSLSALAKFLGYKSVGAVSEIANNKRVHSEHEVRYVEQTDLEGEEWRNAVGYDGIRVSNMGRIQYQTGKRGFGSESSGYKAYQSRNGFIMMHALVMQTFVGPRPDGLDVDHINQDKHDNRVANLRYITRAGNTANRDIDHSLAAKARGKPVLATKDGVTTRYDSTCEAARALGLNPGSIAYNADLGKSHGGYLFEREEGGASLEGEEWTELSDWMLKCAKR